MTTRGSYANGERRRAQLVDDALRVIAEQGYVRLSLRQLAEAMGTSHSLLRHHFGNREALLEAVLVRREETEIGRISGLVDQVGALDAMPQVLAHHKDIRGIIQLDTTLRVEAMDPEHPAHDYMAALDRRFVEALRVGLQRERDLGRLRPGLDLDVVAEQLAALVLGLQIAWLRDERVDMAAAAAAFIDLLRA